MIWFDHRAIFAAAAAIPLVVVRPALATDGTASTLDALVRSSWVLAGAAFVLVFLVTILVGLVVVKRYETRQEATGTGSDRRRRPARWNQEPSEMRVKRRIKDVRQHNVAPTGPKMHDMQG